LPAQLSTAGPERTTEMRQTLPAIAARRPGKSGKLGNREGGKQLGRRRAHSLGFLDFPLAHFPAFLAAERPAFDFRARVVLFLTG